MEILRAGRLSSECQTPETAMTDILLLALGIGAFALLAGYAAACARV